MIKGEITTLKRIPNLNHKIFKGVKIFELRKPKTKKIIARIKRVLFISWLINNR